MILPIFLAAGLTAAATLSGGTLALRFRALLPMLLGFSGGAVLGVALFDLLPEALALSGISAQPLTVTTAMGIGFFLYLSIDRIVAMLDRGSGRRGHLGPASLTLHSLMDGASIGLAFQASGAVGFVVLFAVVAHDLLDGANTVTLAFAGGSSPRTARRWLVADAAAPVGGLALSQLIDISPAQLCVLLAMFAGFFLYIGASELLPRSQAERPGWPTLAATAGGLLFIYVIVRLAIL